MIDEASCTEHGNSPRSCWVVSDGAAGNERQALALADALDLHPRIVRLDLAAPWSWLAPRLDLGARYAIRTRDGTSIAEPWPQIAIGCGRKAALLTRVLRQWSNGRCFSVQMLDPRIDPAAFDLVIAPLHDRLDGHNVIATLGALNRVNDETLASARAHFAHLAALPVPRTAVLIGGPHRAQALDPAWLDALRELLQTAHTRDGGSFLVSTSRRTPAHIVERLRTDFARWPGAFWAGDADGENPYAGFLAWAQRILVSPDSVNMLSEACAVGVPASSLVTRPLSGKLADFHARLAAHGHLTAFGAPRHPAVAALRESASVAAQVFARWNEQVQGAS